MILHDRANQCLVGRGQARPHLGRDHATCRRARGWSAAGFGVVVQLVVAIESKPMSIASTLPSPAAVYVAERHGGRVMPSAA